MPASSSPACSGAPASTAWRREQARSDETNETIDDITANNSSATPTLGNVDHTSFQPPKVSSLQEFLTSKYLQRPGRDAPLRVPIPCISGEATRDQTAPFTIAAAQGTAPDFAGISNWFNSAPLNIANLRGKVVLVDFWTYGCVNCVNTLPHVTELYAKYKDRGLVVVGVHTPEFPFERSASNMQAALKRHGITYPVAQDNDSQTWNAYRNQYWPAQYIVDQSGKIVFQHDGEGQYEQIDRTIARLLNASS